MAQITITEALAEIKTIEKRIEKKREFVLAYLVRQEMFKDPLEKDGGSAAAIRREMQAIQDLEERCIAIRRAINAVNESATITIGERTRSIADWLVWRREIASRQMQSYAALRNKIEHARQDATRKGAVLATNVEAARPNDIIVNINEQELARQIEALEEAQGRLDGQLSLKNATLMIDL